MGNSLGRWSLRAMLAVVVVAAIASTRLVRRPEAVDARVSLDSRSESIPRICAILSSASHVPIDVHPDVARRVFIRVDNAPWRTVLEAVVETDGCCAIEDIGSRLRIVPARTPPLCMPWDRGVSRESNPVGAFQISLTDVTIADVVAEFRRRVPSIRFELDEKGWPDDYRIARLEISAASWREALDEFYVQHEAQWDQDDSASVRISRPPRVMFGAREGPLLPTMDLFARMSGANIVMNQDVQGVVRYSPLHNVPWPKAIEVAVTRLGAFVMIERNGIYRIAPGTIEAADQVPAKLQDLGLRGRIDDDRLVALVARLQDDGLMEQRLAEEALMAAGPAAAGVLHRAWEEARTTDLRIRLARIVERIWSARR